MEPKHNISLEFSDQLSNGICDDYLQFEIKIRYSQKTKKWC